MLRVAEFVSFNHHLLLPQAAKESEEAQPLTQGKLPKRAPDSAAQAIQTFSETDQSQILFGRESSARREIKQLYRQGIVCRERILHSQKASKHANIRYKMLGEEQKKKPRLSTAVERDPRALEKRRHAPLLNKYLL